MKATLFSQAEKLHKRGFAIHWLHPKEKRPVENGWTKGSRKTWDYLRDTYHEGLNVGVRLGLASKLTNGYLACIDVDIKKSECRETALEKLSELIGDIELPMVTSGAGNGSRHLYCVTAEPFKMITYAKEKGWEICIYSDGRQMVLPPSIHPNGSIYKWAGAWRESDLALMDFSAYNVSEASPGEPRSKSAHNVSKNDKIDIDFVNVELEWLDIPDSVREGIKHATGITDRSSYLLICCNALFSAGLCLDEVLSVLTDRTNALSLCCYDHAKTKNRREAANWLYKYTIRKVEDAKRDVANAFKTEQSPERILSAKEIAKQAEEFNEDKDWKKDLVRGGQHGDGPPKATVQNVVLILQNVVSKKVVRRDEFAFRDTYIIDTPWGTKKNAIISDDDVPRIILWLSRNYGFEPNAQVIYNALTAIACENSYDPVKDWLNSLPNWDETPRLGTWLSENFEAEGDADYLDQVFTKWMVAMVRRVFEPGAKFDWMPIFEGYGGAGKSSFGRILVGDKYFLDWLPNLADKDAALGLQGHWAVEMGELPQFKSNALETIKAFVTRTTDKFRPPHGRKLIESPRRCVFFGTTNKSKYLIDDTGNRRFKPIKVGTLNFEQLREDRTQLFAEARHLYETKFNEDLHFELTDEARVFEASIHDEKMAAMTLM